MKTRYVVAMVSMFAVAPALQAQSSNARIDASLETAVQAGIPVELLRSKIAEGRAKGVSEDRIAAAVEARLRGLRRASEAMKKAEVESTSAADLAVGADALEAGVSENALVKISKSAPAERRAVAVATLTGLVQLGHANERALARVSAVVRSNADLARLNAEVARQLQGRGRVDAGVGVDLRGRGRNR